MQKVDQQQQPIENKEIKEKEKPEKRKTTETSKSRSRKKKQVKIMKFMKRKHKILSQNVDQKSTKSRVLNQTGTFTS